MSPSQASSDDFPRLSGARNFDVWKARVSASLDGKHLLGFVIKKDYNGVSDDEDEDSEDGFDMSDVEDTFKPASSADVDSDEVDFEDSFDELQPSDDNDDNPSVKEAKGGNLSPVRPLAQRSTGRDRKPAEKEKPIPPSARQLRRMEAQTKAFLMKTMDDTHIRLVKNLTTAYDIFLLPRHIEPT